MAGADMTPSECLLVILRMINMKDIILPFQFKYFVDKYSCVETVFHRNRQVEKWWVCLKHIQWTSLLKIYIIIDSVLFGSL